MVYMIQENTMIDQTTHWDFQPQPFQFEDYQQVQLCLDLWDGEVSEEYERWLDDLEAANPPWSDR
jgi:hypothetical protein